VVKALKAGGVEPEESQLAKYADTLVSLESGKVQQTLKLLELLDDHDDVQNVWANADISEEQLEAASAS
jgi:transcriptional/translational regulatory protein YebC/TACO1